MPIVHCISGVPSIQCERTWSTVASVYWVMCSECGACGAMHSAVFSVYSVVCCEFGGLDMRCATPSVCCVQDTLSDCTLSTWRAMHVVHSMCGMLSTLCCVPRCVKDPGCCAVVSLCHSVSCLCLAHDMLCGQCVVCPYKDEDCLLRGNKLSKRQGYILTKVH